MSAVTVGIDIGTTSVKAIAADADGEVLARARVPHELRVPAPDRMEHDVDAAWRRGVLAAYGEVASGLDVAGVNVAAMVPSLGAVGAGGTAVGPGLLYGDVRGRQAPEGVRRDDANPAESGELLGFLTSLARDCPDAAGYWPAQAVANHALSGRGAIDTATAFIAFPLFDGTRWDPELAAAAGATPEQLPQLVAGFEPVGRVGGPEGPLLGGGTIDAMGEQIVAGADADGDVLVICGATLITWAVMSEWVERPGLWTIPHTAPGKVLIGGPSNSGGLFVDWVRRLSGAAKGQPPDAADIPVFLPYVRGERTPLHRPDLRASIHGLALTHGPDHVVRAAHEAGGFVVRHHLELAADVITPRRLVVTGGGVRSADWVQALADCTGLPADVVAVPEGGALGSAFVARCVAGVEDNTAAGARWARTARTVEPDPVWSTAAAERYARFRALTAAELE